MMLVVWLALYLGFLGILFYFSLHIAGFIEFVFGWVQSKKEQATAPTPLAELSFPAIPEATGSEQQRAA